MTGFGNDVTLIAQFNDTNELGLALEQMAGVLSENGNSLTQANGLTCAYSPGGWRLAAGGWTLK